MTKIRKFLDRSQCHGLTDIIDRAIEDDSIKIWRDEKGADVRIFNAERKIPVFRPLFDSMINCYATEYGRKPRYALLMVNRVLPIEGNLGSGGGWHRDSWFNQRKVFVFLSDVGEANGPLEYIPGTDTLTGKLIDLVRYRRSLRVSAEHASSRETKLLTVPAGHGFYLDTTVLHRGRPIQEGVRYAATLYAFDSGGAKLQKSRERFESL